ncbi:hypothetical protein TNCV_4084831 [Trichonephila clavipes]|nr:hypothetical protein TNCV_4084831 [Trichonephila clavipes]
MTTGLEKEFSEWRESPFISVGAADGSSSLTYGQRCPVTVPLSTHRVERPRSVEVRNPHVGVAWNLEIDIELRSELSDLSDDDNAVGKTYESRVLEGESSSDESNEETHVNI